MQIRIRPSGPADGARTTGRGPASYAQAFRQPTSRNGFGTYSAVSTRVFCKVSLCPYLRRPLRTSPLSRPAAPLVDPCRRGGGRPAAHGLRALAPDDGVGPGQGIAFLHRPAVPARAAHPGGRRQHGGGDWCGPPRGQPGGAHRRGAPALADRQPGRQRRQVRGCAGATGACQYGLRPGAGAGRWQRRDPADFGAGVACPHGAGDPHREGARQAGGADALR